MGRILRWVGVGGGEYKLLAQSLVDGLYWKRSNDLKITEFFQIFKRAFIREERLL